MNIMLLLSGLVLVNKEIDKKPLENVTPIVEHYKIIPQEVIQRDIQLIAKKNTTKKNTKKKVVKKKVSKKKVKKVVKKKKTTKKKVVKKTKKKTYIRYNKSEVQNYTYNLMLQKGWSANEWYALDQIVRHESSWNPNAVNKRSGACGLFQSYPCSKMAKYGRDYRTNYKVQANWGLNYIKARYGSPSNAWNFWQRHHWY